MLSWLAEWVTDVIDHLGYVGVALLVALENVFPPIPSEVVLPFAGFSARDGDANLVGMILAATVGSVAGAAVLHGIAARIGPARLDRILVRYGRWLRITPDDVAKSNAWFDRYSDRAVLLCRCVPLVRSLISVPAGFRRMPLVRFLVFTAIGSAIWNGALVGAGYALRSSWDRVEPVISALQYAVLASFTAAVAHFVWRRFWSPQRRQPTAVGDETSYLD